jgi:hypothetical protein
MLGHEADELRRWPVVCQLTRLHRLVAKHVLEHTLAHSTALLRLVNVEIEAAERIHLDSAPGLRPHEELLDAHLEQAEPETITCHKVQSLVPGRPQLIVRCDYGWQSLRPRRGFA